MNINTVLSNMITKDYTDEKKWQKDKGKLWEIDRYMQDYEQINLGYSDLCQQ